MQQFLILTGLNFDDFRLKEEDFDHHSERHGILHTYRVMWLVLLIAWKCNLKEEARLAFCAAYIHDMSRKHDGFCQAHGLQAAINKFPLYSKMFYRNGIRESQANEIKKAVEMHSQYEEVEEDNPYFYTIALLKDADALDRIRLGESNLKPEFLRLEASKGFISYAKQFYHRVEELKACSFKETIKIALRIK